jgi:hypothetical protein
MVDDGTCDLCVRGQCWLCLSPVTWPAERGVDQLTCCCNEGYDLGTRPAGGGGS